MDAKNQQLLIENYITAYNQFDVPGMLKDLHPDIEFRNISSGNVTLALQGIEAFKTQAQQASAYFSQRKQTVTSFRFKDQQVEVTIDYKGILAIDLPNGLKSGSIIELKGKSIYRFRENQIILIEDIS